MLLVPCRRRLIFIITQACRSRDREGSTQDREELWHPGLRGRQAMEDSSAGIRQFLRWPWDWSFRLSAQFMVEPNIQMWRYRVRWQASTWLIIYIYILCFKLYVVTSFSFLFIFLLAFPNLARTDVFVEIANNMTILPSPRQVLVEDGDTSLFIVPSTMSRGL